MKQINIREQMAAGCVGLNKDSLLILQNTYDMKEDSLICLFLLRLHLVIFCINSWTTHRCRGTQTQSPFSVFGLTLFSTLQSINKPRLKPPPEQSRSRFHCLRTTYTHTRTHIHTTCKHSHESLRSCLTCQVF